MGWPEESIIATRWSPTLLQPKEMLCWYLPNLKFPEIHQFVTHASFAWSSVLCRQAQCVWLHQRCQVPRWPVPEQQPRMCELGISDLTWQSLGNEVSLENLMHDAFKLQRPNLFLKHKSSNFSMWRSGTTEFDSETRIYSTLSLLLPSKSGFILSLSGLGVRSHLERAIQNQHWIFPSFVRALD